jgi:hypothetical protein
MVGQIDEFKRIRARVKQAAIVQHLRPMEVDKIDSDVKDFLDDPEVKDGFERLSEADEKMDNCLAQLAEFETMEGDQSAPEFSAEDVASNEAVAEYRESQHERHLSAEYATVEAQKDSVAYDCLKHATTIRKHSEEFAKNHPYWSKAGSWALKGVGYLGIAGLVKAGIKMGGKRMVTFFGSQMLSQEIVASVIENGTDSLVDYAISHANDENEAAEFAETAVWSVETALAGVEIAGITALIKDMVAVSSTLAATKVNVPATARAKFAQKQNLRMESSQKLSAIAKEKVMARTQQRSIGNVGIHGKLVRGAPTGGFGDNKEAHHIVPQRYLKEHNINPKSGLSVMLTEEQHMETNTYAQKARDFDLKQSFRDATAEGLKDTIRVEKENGIYIEGRSKLLEGLKEHKGQFPDLYKKEKK